MNKIKAFLAALSFAGVAAKFSGAFGPVGAIIGAVLTFGLQIIKWFFEGVTVIVSNPVTLVTVSTVAGSAFLGGVKVGKEWDQYLVDRKEATIQQMIADGEKADAENKRQFEAALAAKKAAQDDVKSVPTTTITPAGERPAPVVKRVRPASEGKGLNQIGGPSLQWFGDVFK